MIATVAPAVCTIVAITAFLALIALSMWPTRERK